jgi:hypothetical protein
MRTRLFTALFLLLVVVTVLLVTSSQMPASDILVPSQPRCTKTDHVLPVPVLRTEATSTPVHVPTLLVNTRRIRLNYQIQEVGPSGVSAVELWATRDGQSWQRYSNEPPPAGPLVVQVAEEGRYGFSIVVRNGVGLSSPAPQTNDPPQIWVEVDETRPVVRLLEAQAGQGNEIGYVHIAWRATDAHLTARPITLKMSKSKDGPWTTIASNLPNTGRYTWKVPADVPYRFYVCVEAVDRAGNVGFDVASEPISIDLLRPRGIITGLDHGKPADLCPATPVEVRRVSPTSY